MNVGAFDRKLTIQTFTSSANASNEPVKTWSTFCTIWAKRDWKSGGEAFEADKLTARNKVVYRGRYYAGITPKMRIVDGSETLEITSVEEVLRKHVIQIEAEVVVL